MGADETQEKCWFSESLGKELRNRLQSTCVVLMGFGEITISEENLLEELRVGKLKNGNGDEITGEIIKD